MAIPAEYRAEYDRTQSMKSKRELTGRLIVAAIVEGDVDRALALGERWKEENAEFFRLAEVEEAARRRHVVLRAARRIGLVLGDPA
jgi:hypothetical protein